MSFFREHENKINFILLQNQILCFSLRSSLRKKVYIIHKAKNKLFLINNTNKILYYNLASNLYIKTCLLMFPLMFHI